MTVAVVIVNWNGERFLGRCLAALAGQSVQPEHIVIVDNASSDRSFEVARAYPAVEWFALDGNAGFARANNLAVARLPASVDWVALLNPDAFPEPRWLEELLLAVKRHPEAGAFGSVLLDAADPERLDGLGDAYHLSGLPWRVGHGQSVDCLAELRTDTEIFSPCAAAALYRRQAYVEVGGLDEDFFCYVEDVDLGWRLRLAGYRCWLAPRARALHLGSATSGGKQSDFALYHGHRNLVWAFVANMPGWLFWASLPLHLALNMAALAIFAVRGRGRTLLRAKRDALRGLPGAWRKRRSRQAARRMGVAGLLPCLEHGILPGRKRLRLGGKPVGQA